MLINTPAATPLARAGMRPSRASNILIFGYSLLWCLSFAKRRLRFVWGLTAVVCQLMARDIGNISAGEVSSFRKVR